MTVKKQQLYIQIALEYEKYIQMGVFLDGEKLPSVREIAMKLGVNPNTVNRSFKWLEEKGLIETIPKKGAFVTYNKDKNEQLKTIYQELKQIKESNISKTTLIKLIDKLYDGGSDDAWN